MDDTSRANRWKPGPWRRAFIIAALGGAAFIPSCSEDPTGEPEPAEAADEPVETAPPGGPPAPPGLDPYLGYSR